MRVRSDVVRRLESADAVGLLEEYEGVVLRGAYSARGVYDDRLVVLVERLRCEPLWLRVLFYSWLDCGSFRAVGRRWGCSVGFVRVHVNGLVRRYRLWF